MNYLRIQSCDFNLILETHNSVTDARAENGLNLWGFVKNPGRYEVPSSTDLIQLLSFAGGPVQYAKLDEVKVTP